MESEIVFWLYSNAGWIMAMALVAIAMAALGYFTCAGDLQREKAQAWNLGYDVGQADLTKATELQEEIEPSPNPYLPRRPFRAADKQV